MPHNFIAAWILFAHACLLTFSDTAVAGGFIQMKGKKTVLKDEPKKNALPDRVDEPSDTPSGSGQLGSYMPPSNKPAAQGAEPEKGVVGGMIDSVKSQFEQLKTIQQRQKEQQQTLEEIEKEL